jgi:hypothetical protein
MRRYVGIVLGLCLLLFTLSLTNVGTALAQGPLKPVMSVIINDKTNPVPVTGNIGLASGSSIIVGNPATSPVFVRDVDNVGARQVVSQSIAFNMGNASGNCGGMLNVPAGKRLVIENVSANLFIQGPPRPLSIGLTQVSAPNTFIDIPLIDKGIVSTYNVGVASQQTHIYTDTSIEACVSLSGPSGANVSVEVNGYLTDIQ